MAQAIAVQRPASPRTKLRELGIYALPDGNELIVSTIYHDGCNIYTPHSWETFGTAEYWVDGDGLLLRRGEPSKWKLEDLRDTGKTARYPKPALR